MTAPAPPCLHCGAPREEWPDHSGEMSSAHEFSPCCSDECLALAVESGKHPTLMVGPDSPPNGVRLIAEERARQVSAEGWSAEHDAGHSAGEMARAAAVYATPELLRKMVWRTSAPMGDYGRGDTSWQEPVEWPWGGEWYKPTPDDRVRELVKAGALIAAEIDRLQRAEVSP